MPTDSLKKLVVIGLGSNLQPLLHLRRALLDLRRLAQFKIVKVSKIYESSAQLPSNAPLLWDQPFLNAAVLMEVQDFEPLELLKTLKSIEIKMGRIQNEKWAPRTIDLDILFVENFSMQTENLQIPHARLFERPFAYLPAKEVYPSIPFNHTKNHATFDTHVSNRYFWPEFVGILNITPDSFTDGGKFLKRENFLAHARKLVSDGADYLDIGAESTRPQAEPISSELEIARLNEVLPYLEQLRSEGLHFKTSIDSRHFKSIRHVLDNYKIDLINDVSGLSDLRTLSLIKEYNLSAVCMHSLSVPARKETVLKADADPVKEISQWWSEREKIFSQFNFHSNQIYFDPGFGFGKTAVQSHFLFDHLEDFLAIQQPFFLGYSRKSFLKKLPDSADRDLETSLMTQKINPAFFQFLRVHNIEIQKKALRLNHEL